MSYHLRDANGYLRDICSIGGWSEVLAALESSGGVVQAFLSEGKSYVPALLADGLARFLERSKGIPEGTRHVIEKLIDAARAAEGIIILSNGSDDREEYEELSAITLGQTDYAAVEKALDALEDDYHDQFTMLIDEMQLRVIKRVKQAQPVDALPYMPEFNRVLKAFLKEAHTLGRKDGWMETRPSLQDIGKLVGKKIEAFADDSFTPKSAIKWLRAKELFISGVFEDGLLGAIRNLLVNALKTGKSTAEVVDAVYDVFEPYLGDPDKLKDGVPPAPHRLNTMLRTATTEAYNHGRLTEYLDPELEPYMQGVRYSAILDGRTTEVCRLLDGRIFKLGDPDLPGLCPPNHYNCRSILVPVVVGEQVDRGDFITPAQKGKAKQKADTKFLSQKGEAA